MTERGTRANVDDDLAELHRSLSAVAHDADIPLSIAADRVLALLADVPAGTRLRTELEAIGQGIRTAHGVLDEAAGGEPKDAADIPVGFRRLFRLARPWLPRDLHIGSVGLEHVGKVGMSDVDLLRLLHNLVLNAAAAISGEGEIMVRADELDAIPGGKLEPGREVPCVRLTVADSGKGIRSAHVARAFWTSTSRATDTPISGLAIVYSIVRAAGGRVEIETKRSKGTQIHCYLPRATT